VFTARKLASTEIRETFLRFFEERGHLRIRGASLLPKNDPTLLYINSGMAPLKRYFTGEERPPHPDLCNIQPCIRTKDIDDVGDRHHLTFFEMLGSWSINHYFKQHAVELAYELLVERFGFPAERLYATVYGGDPDLNLPPDDESVAAWERVGLARNHIVVLGEDNFWGPAGDTGPCGPCTEVFFDTGDEHGPPYREGGHFDTKARYIEIWNAGVFMEYDKHAEGVYAKLPFRSVDTGSGLERMSMVLNALESVYETDLVEPLMQYIADQLPNPSVSLATRRRIADHMRASAFILAEGVIPSNEGRGYIPRRLIRKCSALVFREGAAFDYRGLIDLVIERFGGLYARLKEKRRQIHEAFANERTDFEQVIDRGLRRLDALSEKRPFLVSGKDAFALFSTFGMPYDLIRDFVADREGKIDEAGYLQEFRTHQEVSRVSRKAADVASAELAELYQTLSAQIPVVEFVGYETLTSAARILAMVDTRSSGPRRLREATHGEEIEVILDRTPAYAKAGGQVGAPVLSWAGTAGPKSSTRITAARSWS
jgi:alanyl-tRNA synthetase